LKKIIAIVATVFAAGCGAGVAEDHEDSPVVLNDDYAVLEQPLADEPWAEMCTGRTGPGSVCFVPKDLNVKNWDYLYTNGGPVWYTAINDERNTVKDRLNGYGWNFSIATTDAEVTWRLQLGTVHPTIPGRVAEAAYYVDSYIPAADGGTYALHRGCLITLYKTTIEGIMNSKALTEPRRIVYLRNIVDHEFMHCAGPPHVNVAAQLMSADAGGPVYGYYLINLNPNAEHSGWLDRYLNPTP
jgi:hypothetical protein